MIRAFYSAASGMRAQQQSIDVCSNNIANLGTVGFKKSAASFSDNIYDVYMDAEDGETGIRIGNGSRVDSVLRDFRQGNIYDTGNPLDLAIVGDGFFVVDNGMGERYYTRDGSFRLSVEPQGVYMVTASGDYLLDDNGNRILLTAADVESLEIDSTGLIRGQGTADVRIGLVTFPNPGGLEAVGGNLYRQTIASGQTLEQGAVSIKQYSLESSNADLIEEITNMLKAQRAFQLSSRVVQAADEMEGTANNMRT